MHRRYFTGPVPPTSTVVVAPMARDHHLVEIAAIAGTELRPGSHLPPTKLRSMTSMASSLCYRVPSGRGPLITRVGRNPLRPSGSIPDRGVGHTV